MIKFLGTHSGKVFLNVFISVGAAVVILGALGKILHASWGTIAITSGMLTECLIFLILAFVPQEHHPHWENYYPDLYKDPAKLDKNNKQVAAPIVKEKDESKKLAVAKTNETPIVNNKVKKDENILESDMITSKPVTEVKELVNPALAHLDDMLQNADITPTNLKKLSDSFSKLNNTVAQVADISSSNAYINDFANQTKEANEALVVLKNVYIDAAKNFNSTGFSDGVKEFYQQMQGITKNISSLNAIYGVEINDTLQDIKKVRKYFNNIDVVATQLNDSVEDVRVTKQQIGLLVKNLSNLNNIYGNMLGAMQAPIREIK